MTLALVKFDAESNGFKLLTEFYFDTSDQRGTTFEFVNMKECLTLMTYENTTFVNASSKNMINVYECC